MKKAPAKITPIRPPKDPDILDQVELEEAVLEHRRLGKEIDSLKTTRDKLGEKLVKTLGPKGIYQHLYPEAGLLKCTVTRMRRRSVPWKELFWKLARKVYPAIDFSKLVRKIAKDYPKKPTKDYVLVNEIKQK